LVEPLCVVHDAQQRLLLGRLSHQAERPEGDQEPVAFMSRGKPERDAERASLGLGERIDAAEHRTAQLVQSGEGKLHLRFDTGHADHVETGRLPDQVVQQGRLADPRTTRTALCPLRTFAMSRSRISSSPLRPNNRGGGGTVMVPQSPA
jgi:hypothetical protein